MLLAFPSQKGFVWVFRGCAPVGRRSGSLPPIQPRLLEDPPILPTDSAIEPQFRWGYPVAAEMAQFAAPRPRFSVHPPVKLTGLP